MSGLSTVEVLRGAKTVLECNGWFRGHYVDRRPEFRGTPLRECPVCLLGALNLASGRAPQDDYGFDEPERFVLHALRNRGVSAFVGVAHWNDSPDRTLAEVSALLDEAIVLAEGSAS